MRRFWPIGEHDVIRDDLRDYTSSFLRDRRDVIAGDAAAIFSQSAPEPLDAEYCVRVARLLVELLATAIGDGRLDGCRGFVAHVLSEASERPLRHAELFWFAYTCERAALDDLALDPDVGATTEAWPLVSQLVRRGSFEALAALSEGSGDATARAAITDPTTTLLTRLVFDAALAREADRAGRFGDALALTLFRVDRAADLDRQHGFGVAEKVMQRLGILIRGYFRRHDWMARTASDEIAVLLTRADAHHAADLAERVRATVEQRLAFADHRSGQAVSVTVSAAVVEEEGRVGGSSIDPERVFVEAQSALERARQRGGNCIERADGSATRIPPRNLPSA